MAAPRGEFTSRFGFLMAASGSAVGLGNIWGFRRTQPLMAEQLFYSRI